LSSIFSLLSRPQIKACKLFILTTALLSASGPLLSAQQSIAIEASLNLPDAPSAVSSSRSIPAEDARPVEDARSSSPWNFLGINKQVPEVAPRTAINIMPGQRALPLRTGDKILLGIRGSATPLSVVGWVASAGYSHLTNGSPNYGTNSGAFAQRFGAAAARNASEDIFSDSIMAPIFHQDPRYYVMGRHGHSFIKRALYAGTRPIIGRTDGGRTVPNYAILTGNLGGAALTNLYYPPLNQGFSQTMQTFGSSLGGSAIGFLVTEFYTDALELVHLKKAE
jgi:hypothetical protein